MRLSQQMDLFGIELQTVESDLARSNAETGALRAVLAEGESANRRMHMDIASGEREVATLRQQREEKAAT